MAIPMEPSSLEDQVFPDLPGTTLVREELPQFQVSYFAFHSEVLYTVHVSVGLVIRRGHGSHSGSKNSQSSSSKQGSQKPAPVVHGQKGLNSTDGNSTSQDPPNDHGRKLSQEAQLLIASGALVTAASLAAVGSVVLRKHFKGQRPARSRGPSPGLTDSLELPALPPGLARGGSPH